MYINKLYYPDIHIISMVKIFYIFDHKNKQKK